MLTRETGARAATKEARAAKDFYRQRHCYRDCHDQLLFAHFVGYTDSKHSYEARGE